MKTLTQSGFMRKMLIMAFAMLSGYSVAQTPFMKVVAADGTGDYKTINEAVSSCTADGTRSFIFIKNGTYKEQVKIPKGVTLSLIGENRDKAIVTHDVSHASGLDKEETSTIYVEAFDFYGENFTTQHTAGRNGGQAECITNSGDRMVFRNVAMKGNQDAVRFDHASRSYMTDCYIEGTVDYIYDSGIAFLDNCDIKQLWPGYVIAPGNSYVALSRGQIKELTGQRGTRPWYIGIVIRDSRLIRDATNVSDGASYLGRPWGKDQSAGVFIRCKMDKHISEQGFTNMSEGTVPYIGEWKSTDLDGNPIDMSKRIEWEFTEDADRGTLYYMNRQVVDNVYDNMDFVYTLAGDNGARAGGKFDPLPMVTPPASPTGVSLNDGVFTWTPVEGAAGYLIYKDGRYLGNTSQPTFADAGYDTSARYTLRSVSTTGCLGKEIDMLTSGVASLLADDINITTTEDGIFWNGNAQATLYGMGGSVKTIADGEKLSWRSQSRGCYILRLVFAGKGCVKKKVVKK